MNKHLKGNALITAIFVMSLVAIAAMAMTLRLKIDIKRSELSQNQIQRLHLFRNQSLQTLMTFLNQNNVDKLQIPPFDIQKVQTPLGTLQGKVNDPEAYFNINNFLSNDPKQFAVFKQLMMLVEPTLSQDDANDILAQIMQQTVKRKKEYYVSVSELYDALGNHYNAIAPHLVALPSTQSKLHPFGATPAVLAAYYPQLDLEAAKHLLFNIESISLVQRIQLFQQMGITVQEGDVTPNFIMLDFSFKDLNHGNFVFKKIYQIDQKQVKTVSENWF